MNIELCNQVIAGGYSEEATPVPIPNTEVKLLCADDTALLRVEK
jgi:hypothetical protein